MEIRKMQISDYKAVYDLWLSCKGMGLNDVDDSEKGISRFLERNPETCFVAIDNNEIMGVILCGNDGRRGYIYHTAVKSSERNNGIGTKLVDRAMKAFEDIGITKVALVVFEQNETGNIFWEKKGFTSREDLVYRNKQITEMIRIDT
ncbi:MAG: GNAT family N-acetyltransferase [Oscillospiraceae bacterium]|nr:GNAT family N-acetyltransferase [Oscillospiraceae bacterium]